MNSRFRNVFSNQHVVLPVIHVESQQQALRNAEIAHETGCDGIFLINHNVSHAELMDIHQAVAESFADWWIGINSLGREPASLFPELSDAVAGLWTDNAQIDERLETQEDADEIESIRKASGWEGLYFGGVAFKYQREVTNLQDAARIATHYLDVVTTSGPGTGSAASRDKIAAMKQAIREFPLAIASGITPENVSEYLGIGDCFLVATGISTSFTELDPVRAKRLVDVVRSVSTLDSPASEEI